MIAPLRTPESTREPIALRKARRAVAEALLVNPADAPPAAPRVPAWQAWLLAGWMCWVLAHWLWVMWQSVAAG